MERLFEDKIASLPPTAPALSRLPTPQQLRGVTVGFLCTDASVPLDVGSALAGVLLRVVCWGANVVIPHNSSLLHTATFIEMMSAKDFVPSHGIASPRAACLPCVLRSRWAAVRIHRLWLPGSLQG